MNTYVHSAHGHCEHGHIQSVLASSTHGAERMCDCMAARGEPAQCDVWRSHAVSRDWGGRECKVQGDRSIPDTLDVSKMEPVGPAR